MIKIVAFLAFVALAQGGVIAPIVPVAHPVVHPVHTVAAVSHTAVVHPAPLVHAPVVHAPVVHAAPLVHAPVVPVVKHAPIVAVHGVHHG